MIDQVLCVSTFLAALGSGLIAGVFFAFSAFVMTALSRLPAPGGISAMQSITAAIKSPPFLGVFFGTAVLALLLGLAAPFTWSEPGALYSLVGSLLYLNGPFGVTLLRNVALNNQLAGVGPESAEGAKFWQHFLSSWTMWNHVRTVTALAAAAAFIMALAEGGASVPSGD